MARGRARRILALGAIRAIVARYDGDAGADTGNSGPRRFAGQVRVRFKQEQGRRPGIWGSVEVIRVWATCPQMLIGDKLTDVKGEIGFTRGYRVRTMSSRPRRIQHGDPMGSRETSLEILGGPLGPTGASCSRSQAVRTGAPDEWGDRHRRTVALRTASFIKIGTGSG